MCTHVSQRAPTINSVTAPAVTRASSTTGTKGETRTCRLVGVAPGATASMRCSPSDTVVPAGAPSMRSVTSGASTVSGAADAAGNTGPGVVPSSAQGAAIGTVTGAGTTACL